MMKLLASIVLLLPTLGLAQSYEKEADISKLLELSSRKIYTQAVLRESAASFICFGDAVVDNMNFISSVTFETVPGFGLILYLADRIDQKEFDGEMLDKQISLIYKNKDSQFSDEEDLKFAGNLLGGGLWAIVGSIIGAGVDIIEYVTEDDYNSNRWDVLNEIHSDFTKSAYARTSVEFRNILEDSEACEKAKMKHQAAWEAYEIKTALNLDKNILDTDIIKDHLANLKNQEKHKSIIRE